MCQPRRVAVSNPPDCLPRTIAGPKATGSALSLDCAGVSTADASAQYPGHPIHRHALADTTHPKERAMLTYDFRLPPGPRTVDYALLAEELGFR
ncbi:MAG: hypothetical protein JSS43_13740, partial [Proteobacteria bacterium]|nr:hypothetical protein [Pseudomonadota bacterium]